MDLCRGAEVSRGPFQPICTPSLREGSLVLFQLRHSPSLGITHAVACLLLCTNASNSALTLSLRVEHMPWGAPGMTLSLAPLTSLEERRADAPMGTIWSSSPCRISVGTSNFLRSSVKSVSENALMQSMTPLKPASIPWSQNESRRPCETLAPGRLAP